MRQTTECIAHRTTEAILTTKARDRIKAEATIEAEAAAITDAEEAEVEVAITRVRTNLAKTRTLNSSNKTCLNSNNMAITK